MRAIIGNARAALELEREFGSLCAYFWSFSKGKTIVYQGHGSGRIPVSNGLSARISKDLKMRGFRFVGPVTIYSHLQACGIVMDHDSACPCRARVLEAHPSVTKRRDKEVF